MSRIPTFETALLALNDAFQAAPLRTAEKSRFHEGRLEAKGHLALSQDILMGIFARIWPDADPSAKQAALREDMLIGAIEHFSALETISTQSRTWEADSRQTLWLAATRLLAPGAGRKLACWSLDFNADQEMQGGALWFLPQIEDDDTLRLPMATACEHLAGIAREGREPLEKVFGGENSGVRLRRFQSWRLDGVLPGVDLMMTTLNHAIGVLKLDAKAPALRRRFLTARAAQWAHLQLTEALAPGVAPTEIDPFVNKALQVWALFRLAHDLTVKAGVGPEDVTQAQFYALIPAPFREEIFASLVISPFSGLESVVERLTHRCSMLEPGAPLEDLFEDREMTRPRSPVLLSPRPGHHEMGQLCMQMSELRGVDHPERETIMRRLLKEARVHPCAAAYAPDLAMFDALHELNKGNGVPALTRLDAAWDACAASWPGDMARQIAFLRLGLGAMFGDVKQVRARARDALRLISREEAVFRALPEDPNHALEDLIRQAATHTQEHEMRLYPSAARSSGQEAFKQAVSALFDAHRRGEDLSAWVKRFKDALAGRPDPVTRDTGLMMLWKGAWNAGNGGMPPQAAPALRAGVLEAMRRLPHKVLEAHDWKRQTLLALAVDGNDSEAFEILIERQVTLDAQDFLGRSALHAAALAGEEEMFIRLVAKGANLAVETCMGRTPFTIAVHAGRTRAALHALAIGRDQIKDDLPSLCATLREIIEDHDGFSSALEDKNRVGGTREDHEVTLAILEKASSNKAA
jgi:hypothetical protein